MAYLKMKVGNGKIAVFNVYALHNLKPHDERFDFYLELGKLLKECSVNGRRFLFGDFNARIGRRRAGEENICGEYGFAREAMHEIESPNRDLLVEFCSDFEYVVANTIHQAPDDHKVTFAEAGCGHLLTVSDTTHNMLDLALVPSASVEDVVEIKSCREAVLATDHYLVYCRQNVGVDVTQKQKPAGKDFTALSQPTVWHAFVNAFKAARDDEDDCVDCTVETEWDGLRAAFQVAEASLPSQTSKPNKPWMSADTLD